MVGTINLENSPGNRRRSRRGGLSRLFARDRQGSVAIEFALVMPTLIILIMAIFQIAIMFMANQIMETAVTEMARQIRTGQVQQNGIDQAAFRKGFCAHVAALITCSDTNLLLDVQVLSGGYGPVDLGWPVDEEGDFKGKGAYQPGAKQDVVLVRAFHQMPVWLPFLGSGMSNLPKSRRLLAASAAFTNEAFSPTNTASNTSGATQ